MKANTILKSEIKAYKLVSVYKDGSLGPLFVDRRNRFKLGVWHKAKAIRKSGFKYRPGFHACPRTYAPHLSKNKRAWCEVTLREVREYIKPPNQGGLWYTAKYMRIDNVLEKT